MVLMEGGRGRELLFNDKIPHYLSQLFYQGCHYKSHITFFTSLE